MTNTANLVESRIHRHVLHPTGLALEVTMVRSIPLILAFTMVACGTTTPTRSTEGGSGGSTVAPNAVPADAVPAEDTPAEPAPTAEPRVDRVWVSSSSQLPFQMMHVYRYSPPAGGDGSWCAHLDAQALGAWPVAADNDAGTLTLWLRPGGPAGSPPPPAEGAPCPAAFPSTGLSDAMLPTSAPAVLNCQLSDGGLRCNHRGQDVDFVDVMNRLSLETLSAMYRENRSPHSNMTGTMFCRSCAPGWDERLTRRAQAPQSLDGETLHFVSGSVSAILGALALNPDSRFSIDVPCPEEDCTGVDEEGDVAIE